MSRKILFQVAAPAILIGLLLVGTCLVSAWSIQRLQKNLSRIVSRNVASLEAALNLEKQMRQLRYHSLLYLSKPGEEGLDKIKNDERMFEAILHRIPRMGAAPEQQEYLDKIETGYLQYHDEMAQLRAEVKRTGPRTDFQQLAETHPIRHVVEPCQALWGFSQNLLQKNASESERVSRQASLIVLLLGLVGPVGGVLCGYGIVRGLTRSIAQLSVRVRDVANRLERPESERGLDTVIDLAAVTLAGGGDLRLLDQQLQQVMQRVEEVMERLQRHHWEMLRAEQLAAVGQLAAGIAHEVRNPLTGMKLLVEAALRPQPRQPLSQEDLEVIHGEITRLEETVKSFLSFARLPAPHRQTCQLSEVVARALELVRARARQQNVELVLVSPKEGLMLSLDEGQFRTVLVNLFLNALDAMPRGGELRVDLDIDNCWCRLRVYDTGSGIAPEIANRLFTPFASTKPTGTGLGLSLSRRILEEHGGQISAANRPKGGACFTILLPQEEEHAIVLGQTAGTVATIP